MPLTLPLYRLEIFFVPDAVCLDDAKPADVRYVSSLQEAGWVDKVLRSSLPNNPGRNPRLRVTSLPVPSPETAVYDVSRDFPPCVHCGEPGIDFAEYGEVWHNACFDDWKKEYNKHLDNLYPESPDK